MTTKRTIFTLLLALAGLSFLPPAARSEGEGSKEPELSCLAARKEVLRLEEILSNSCDEPFKLMTELLNDPQDYRTKVLSLLDSYKSSMEGIFINDGEMVVLRKLHDEHNKLKEEAEQEGVLVPKEVAALMRSAAGVAWAKANKQKLLFGVPQAALTFDPQKARKAQEIRIKQKELFEKYLEAAQRFVTKYPPDTVGELNKGLTKRETEVVTLLTQHRQRKAALADLFLSGRFEHCLGASEQGKEFDLPGMKVFLPSLKDSLRIPQVVAPRPPEFFETMRDGELFVQLQTEAEEEQLQANKELYLIESAYLNLRLYETVRKFLSAPGEPFVKNFSDPNQNVVEAAGNSLFGFGKVLTYDMVVGVYHAAEGLLTKAGNTLGSMTDPVKMGDDFLQGGKEVFTGLKGKMEGDLELFKDTSSEGFPDTPEGKLQRLMAMMDQRDGLEKATDDLKPLNEKIDKVVETGEQALAIYLAGKMGKDVSVKLGEFGKGQLTPAEIMAEFKKQQELNAKAKEILAEEKSGTPLDQEAIEAATQFEQTRARVAEAIEKESKAAEDFQNAVKEAEKQQPKPEVQPPKEETGTGSTVTKTVKTTEGKELNVGETLGEGGMGKVSKLGDNEVIKEWKGNKETALKNFKREMDSQKAVEDAGIDVVQVKETGFLEDGSPYAIKDYIPPERFGNEIMKNNNGKLPPEHQKALLELVRKTYDSDMLGGDFSPKNVVFVEEAGVLKAKMVEGDFFVPIGRRESGGKPVNPGHYEFIAEVQIDQLLGRSDLPLHIAGGGTKGLFQDAFDAPIMEAFQKDLMSLAKKKAEMETANVASEKLAAVEDPVLTNRRSKAKASTEEPKGSGIDEVVESMEEANKWVDELSADFLEALDKMDMQKADRPSGELSPEALKRLEQLDK